MSSEGREAESTHMGLDPWGLRRVERLLHELDGVTSLKIVPDGRGGIDEIHVVSESELGAKQVVRNIESALLAQFGLQIDHRKISVARIRGGDIPSLTEQTRVLPSSRVVLAGVHLERKAGERTSCKVVVHDGESDFTGEAEGPDFARSRLEVAATATLKAIHHRTSEHVSLSLDGASRVQSFGRHMVVVVIRGAKGRESMSLTGIARISDSPEEAAVLACLQATNRWLGGTS